MSPVWAQLHIQFPCHLFPSLEHCPSALTWRLEGGMECGLVFQPPPLGQIQVLLWVSVLDLWQVLWGLLGAGCPNTWEYSDSASHAHLTLRSFPFSAVSSNSSLIGFPTSSSNSDIDQEKCLELRLLFSFHLTHRETTILGCANTRYAGHPQ